MIRIVAHSLAALLRPALPTALVRFGFCAEGKKPEEKSQSITASFTDKAIEESKEKAITNGKGGST
jgi:hypothetical protein